MPLLHLRGTGLGVVEAVLFDKDGTLSISEPQLQRCYDALSAALQQLSQ